MVTWPGRVVPSILTFSPTNLKRRSHVIGRRMCKGDTKIEFRKIDFSCVYRIHLTQGKICGVLL
jgi:hypothetical protein